MEFGDLRSLVLDEDPRPLLRLIPTLDAFKRNYVIIHMQQTPEEVAERVWMLAVADWMREARDQEVYFNKDTSSNCRIYYGYWTFFHTHVLQFIERGHLQEFCKKFCIMLALKTLDICQREGVRVSNISKRVVEAEVLKVKGGISEQRYSDITLEYDSVREHMDVGNDDIFYLELQDLIDFDTAYIDTLPPDMREDFIETSDYYYATSWLVDTFIEGMIYLFFDSKGDRLFEYKFSPTIQREFKKRIIDLFIECFERQFGVI